MPLIIARYPLSDSSHANSRAILGFVHAAFNATVDTPTCAPDRFFKFHRADNESAGGRISNFNPHDFLISETRDLRVRNFPPAGFPAGGGAGLASLWSSQTTRTNYTFSNFGNHLLIVAGQSLAWSPPGRLQVLSVQVRAIFVFPRPDQISACFRWSQAVDQSVSYATVRLCSIW